MRRIVPTLGLTSVGILLLLTNLGCSTQYTPKPGPRVSMIVQAGKPAYVRDGRVYEHGLVGDGLVEAVHGDPEAVEAAETYRDRQVTSLVALGVSAACGTGFMITATQAMIDADEPHQDGRNSHEVRDGLTVGFAACMIGGLITAVATQAGAPANHYDAINIYNDDLQNSCPVNPPDEPRLGPRP